MKIILSFFSVLILFYGCSKESDSTDEWVDVSFIPSIEYIMTPLNSRSDDIQEPNLLGLIYTSNNIESVVIPENNTFSVKLKMGQYYTIVFIANGIPYLNNFEKYSTAHLMLDTVLAPNRYGSEIYIATMQVRITSISPSPITITLTPIVSALVFVPEEIPRAGEIKEMTTTQTNIRPTYYLDPQNKKTTSTTATVKTSESTEFKFFVYSFSSEKKTQVVSEINRFDHSTTWNMGNFDIYGNKYYQFEGELK